MQEKIFFILKNDRVRAVSSIIMLLIAIMVMVVGIRANSILQDEGYMALSCKNYVNSPLAMMIFYVGNEWMSLFGDSLMALRILCRLCLIASLGIGLIYLWGKTKNIVLTAVIGLICGCVSNLGDAGFYSWDTGAYPIMALGTVLLLNYIDNPSTRNVILLGLIGGIMPAVRIPLVAFFALMMVAIIRVNRGKIILRHILLCSTMFFVGWMICILLMTGSLQVYIESFCSENIITGHSVSSLNRYIYHFVNYFPRFVYYALPALVACFSGMLFSYWKKVTLIEICGIELLLLLIAFSFCMEYISNNGTTMPGIGISFFMLCVVWKWIGPNWNGDTTECVGKHLGLRSVLLFLMMLLEGLGSDLFFYRWSVVFLLPIGVGMIWPEMNAQAKKSIKLICIILVPFLAVIVPIKDKLIHSGSMRIEEKEEVSCGGISVPPGFYATYNNLSSVVNELKENKLQFEFVGLPIRYLYSFEFNDYTTERSLLHYYHYLDSDFRIIEPIASANDAIIVIGTFPMTVSYLQDKFNYSVVESNPEYTVLRVNKK